MAIGNCIEVHWQNDAVWYAGTVTAADAGSGTVDVAYGDGDAERGGRKTFCGGVSGISKPKRLLIHHLWSYSA